MKVLYFAWVRQQVGRSEDEIELPSEGISVGQLVDLLKERGPEYTAAFANLGRLRCAVNQNHVGFDAKIHANDEVAFFPPVTGG